MKYFILIILFVPYSLLPNKMVLTYDSGLEIAISIDCPDSLNCYIITQSEDIHKIYKSSNLGNNWNLIYQSKPLFEQPPPPLINAEDACSPNPDYYFITLYQKRYLKKSKDGCKTFENINLGTGGFVLQSIREIAMKDTNTGIVVGDSLFIAMTHDSWKTFKKIDYYTDIPRKGDIGPLSMYSLLFHGADTLLFIGGLYNFKDSTALDVDSTSLGAGIFTWDFKNNECSYILIPDTKWDTTNGNINPVYESLNDIYFVNDTLGFICGYKRLGIGDSAAEIVYKTTNSGISWKKMLDRFEKGFSAWGLQKISFKDALTGIAVGAIGVVCITGDGGETWEYLEKPEHIKDQQVPTMVVTWAGDYPIIGTFEAGFWRVEGPDGGPPVFKKSTKPAIIQAENYDFGNYNIMNKDSLSKILKVYNISNDSDLKINGYSTFTESVFATDLPIADSSNPIIIKPNGFLEYTVFFKPNDVRKYEDSIVFYANAQDSDNVAILTGEGIDDTTSVSDFKNNNHFYFHQPYPQPATDEVILELMMNENIDIKTININIYDIFGNNVDIKNNIKLEYNTSNSGLFKWDCTKVISGTYYVKISYGSEISMLKVMVYK